MRAVAPTRTVYVGATSWRMSTAMSSDATHVSADAADEPEVPAPAARLRLALFLAAVGWYLPFAAVSTVLLPARLAQLDPAGKTLHLGVITGVAAVIALVANIGFGMASDRTRSRFGRRSPWIVGGALGASFALFAASLAGSVPALALSWWVFSAALNAFLAPLIAVIADRVPQRSRGTASAVYGGGLIVGQVLGSVVGSVFLADPEGGLGIVPGVIAVTGVVVVILAPDNPWTGGRPEPVALARTLSALTIRDFSWVLVGRLLLMTAVAMILGFQLFILTDYIGLGAVEAKEVLVIAGLLTGALALAATLLFGIVSDRLDRRRIPVLLAALLVAGGALIPIMVPTVAGFLVFVAIAALGYGGYQAVDTALMTDVLPSASDRARDLGILNVANAGGQTLGPALVPLVLAMAGGYPAVFGAAVVAAALAALCMLPIRLTR